MPRPIARTTLSLGSCTAMTSMSPLCSGVLVGTSTGQVIIGTYARGRIKLKDLDGIVRANSPITILDCHDSSLLVIRNSRLLQIYQLRLKESQISDYEAQLQYESNVDEAPKFRPLFVDTKTLFVAYENSVYNLFNSREQLSAVPFTILGMTQLVRDKSHFLLYGEGLEIWKLTKLAGVIELSTIGKYFLQLQKHATLGTEVTPCILHLCVKDNLTFCATNMGLLLYFPEEQLADSSSEEESVIYVKVYPMVALYTRSILHWGDYLVPCGGYVLELLSLKLCSEQFPELIGTPVMSFEDQSTCAAVSDTFLWICIGGAGICILSH